MRTKHCNKRWHRSWVFHMRQQRVRRQGDQMDFTSACVRRENETRECYSFGAAAGALAAFGSGTGFLESVSR